MSRVAGKQVIPTRMELTRLRRKLATARRGHKLLKDKRDELMRRFLDLVRENLALRREVEQGIRRARGNFVLAAAGMSEEELHLAMALPKQEIGIEVSERNIMSVEVPVFDAQTRTSSPGDLYAYGTAFTAADLDDAVASLQSVLPAMLRLAEIEKSCRMLAAEIEKTRRRVNALEHVMIPQLEENIRAISMKLDENERSTQVRLMKVKDMMLEQAHHYSEREKES